MSLTIQWEQKGKTMVPTVAGANSIAWAPQDGSQDFFLQSRIPELLLEGNRGGGKTEALIMDFGQYVGKGFGQEWRGILFRHTYKQLEDVINKTKMWFPRIWPSATFNSTETCWAWPTGERLYLRHMDHERDYDNYHGHSYPWIAFEELTRWATDKCYRVMMSCWRSAHPNIPKHYRSTTNPYGVGHSWVKKRFQLPVPPGDLVGPIIQDYQGEFPAPKRASIHSSLSENLILLAADPHYINNIAAGARTPAERKAWVEGSWDIVSGGMFDDVWMPKWHVLPPMPSPPLSWRMDRSFDWGSSKPFSVGWWAESDGSDLMLPEGRMMSTVRGDLFRVSEWYGATDEPNMGLRMLASEITQGIVERDLARGWLQRIKPGVADSSIYSVENGMSIAADMALPVRVNGKRHKGVQWLRADKRPGSRKTGWELMRKRLKSSIPTGLPRENPGLFVCSNCTAFIATVPVLPRNLDKDPDDVDTDAEDHVADETRYRVRFSSQRVRGGRTVGMAG